MQKSPNGQRERHGLAFFRGFLRQPEVVGSVIPSSRFLERRIVDACELADARVVVELGPGTGGTTRALLSAMRDDARLLAIDIAPDFVDVLDTNDDPRLIAHCGSAVDLAAILARHALPAPDAVVSGIPFSTMPQETGEAVINGVWAALAPGGRFVAYQFRDRVAEIARPILGAPRRRFEPRNVPPMRVYSWRKTGPAAHAA